MINNLQRQVIDLCYKNKISHISSALNVVDTLDEIYSIRKLDEPVILSCGHCGIGLYVVLNQYFGIDAEYLYKKHGLHPHMDLDDRIYLSTGSLASGVIISCGIALSDRKRNVYCVMSDGECDSGAAIEAFRFKRDNKLDNLKIYVICNGMSAYRNVDVDLLKNIIYAIDKSIIIKDVKCPVPMLDGIPGHYKVLTKEEYETIIR